MSHLSLVRSNDTIQVAEATAMSESKSDPEQYVPLSAKTFTYQEQEVDPVKFAVANHLDLSAIQYICEMEVGDTVSYLFDGLKGRLERIS